MLKFGYALVVLVIIIESVLSDHHIQHQQQPTIDSEKLNLDFYGRVRELLKEKYPNNEENHITVSAWYYY